jgi:hypothetical protein
VDIIGVVEYVNAPITVKCDDGSETQKRSIIMRDDSNQSIELTIELIFRGDFTTQIDRLDVVRLPLSLTTLHLPS